ncbi:hypothetical protein BJX99DRAFT_67919 [Aspergillus californicus]
MGQRHNRRRTRLRSRNHSTNSAPLALDDIAFPTSCAAPCPFASDCLGYPPASPRHYRGLTWQDRDHVLESEVAKVAMRETDQYRLFGGEPGDEIYLCYRMLEYFAGLDYIDPLQDFKPVPG